MNKISLNFSNFRLEKKYHAEISKEQLNNLTSLLLVFDIIGVIIQVQYLALEGVKFIYISALTIFLFFATILIIAKKWNPCLLTYIIPMNFLCNVVISIEKIHYFKGSTGLIDLTSINIIPFQILHSMLLFAKFKWFNCSVIYICSSLYLYFRNFSTYPEKIDFFGVLINIFRNCLIYSYLAYDQEKNFRQYFKTIDESYEKVNYFRLILKNMIPTPIFILDYEKKQMNFLNNSALNFLEQNKIMLEPEGSFNQFELFLNNFSIVHESNRPTINFPSIASHPLEENQTNLNSLLRSYYDNLNQYPFEADQKSKRIDTDFEIINVSCIENQPPQDIFQSETKLKHYYEIKMIKVYWEDSICLFLLFHDHTNSFRISELINQDLNKDQVLASVSHNLRTPVHGIVGMLDIALSKTKDVAIEKYLTIAKKSAFFLNYLVNDILDFSLFSFKKLRLTIEKVNFPEILDETINLFDFQAKERNIDLKCSCKCENFKPIFSDTTRIKQILLNLLSNAFKFTQTGSIELSLESENNENPLYKFTVRDTGIGIRKNDLGKLFKLFGNLENPDKVNKTGIGLGLTISKKISQLLNPNGKGLEVESKFGEGSSFFFFVGSLKKKDEILEEDYKPSFESSICINPIYSTKKIFNDFGEDIPLNQENQNIKNDHKILVVDDDPFSLLIVEQFLLSLNLKCETAINGLAAYKAYKKDVDRKICLVIMDCNMPILDGFQASLKINKYAEKKGIKKISICAMTANLTEGINKLCLEAGMRFVFTKPFIKEEFLMRIKFILKDL